MHPLIAFLLHSKFRVMDKVSHRFSKLLELVFVMILIARSCNTNLRETPSGEVGVGGRNTPNFGGGNPRGGKHSEPDIISTREK